MSETKKTNASQAIREYGQKHGVFGAQEIRTLFGHKAALLCSRLAAKNQFKRIANGVYSMLDDETQQAFAYDTYLERIGEEREKRGKAPDSSLTDQLISHLRLNGGATEVEINRHFGRDMHGIIYSLFKNERLTRTNATYYDAGEKPAERRTTRPSANPTIEEQLKVFDHLKSHPRTTVKAMQADTGIESNRLTNVLESMVRDALVVRHAPISTDSKATYSMAGAERSAAAMEIDEVTMAALAITASEGGVSARGLAVHKLEHDRHQLSRMEEMGLVIRKGEDERLGGALFVATANGLNLLDEAGWKYRGVPAIAHRPLNREVIKLAQMKGGTSIKAIREKTGTTRYIAQIAVQQLADAGVLKTPGKPMKITLTRQDQ